MPQTLPPIPSFFGRDMTDFEDGVLHEAALQTDAHCIVTRKVLDFGSTEIVAYSPEQSLAALASEDAEQSVSPYD